MSHNFEIFSSKIFSVQKLFFFKDRNIIFRVKLFKKKDGCTLPYFFWKKAIKLHIYNMSVNLPKQKSNSNRFLIKVIIDIQCTNRLTEIAFNDTVLFFFLNYKVQGRSMYNRSCNFFFYLPTLEKHR